MHTLIIALVVVVWLAALAAAGWAGYVLFMCLDGLGAQLERLNVTSHEDMATAALSVERLNQSVQQIASHVIGIRATLESVVRVEPAQPRAVSMEPQLQGLTESVTILREAVENMRANPDDIRAQINGIAESVDLLRSTAQYVQQTTTQPRVSALEAPQVPTPHGQPRTLLLLNLDRSIAHEVTWHRDVPKTYAYAGRVFALLGTNDVGQWEFLPC